MEKGYSIRELEQAALDAREAFIQSEEAEWTKLVITLRALSEAYLSESKINDATKSRQEADQILSKRHKVATFNLSKANNRGSIVSFWDPISYWTIQEEKSRKDYQNGGSIAKYAKVVNALCEYLSLAEQYDIALELYRSVLTELRPDAQREGQEKGATYMTIVIMLKASICALDAGKDEISREYSTYPLLYLAENSNCIKEDSSIDWEYVRQLCKDLINKQGKKPLNS